MPPSTKIGKFLKAITTGKSDSMEALDKIFTIKETAEELANNANLMTRLDVADAVKDGLDHIDNKDIKEALKKLGLKKTIELDHIDEWPNKDNADWIADGKYGKDAVRAVIKYALDDYAAGGNKIRAVEFFWQLHEDEQGEGNKVVIMPIPQIAGGKVVGPDGDTFKITFLSPRNRVKLVSDDEFEVTVEEEFV